MIVDTSAWVEYLRATGSPTHLTLRTGVQDGKPIATPALVVTELLSGSRSEIEAAGLLQLLSRLEILIPDSLRDYQGAARVHRICRRASRRRAWWKRQTPLERVRRGPLHCVPC